MPTNYYDSIYGPVQLDDQILEMVSKCPELKRLRFIGMMNFRSLSMLPLTTITRLEHSIGLAYLAQVFVDNNSILHSMRQDLMAASLYHDVNCGPFGHSVEWAIDRYVPFEHESGAKWVKAEDTLSCLVDKPIFLEQDGLHQYHFVEKYNLSLERIDRIIEGNGYFYLNNTGIDLDNIDNVFRMAHYLGLLNDISLPKKLVSALRVSKDLDNFIIDKPALNFLEEWYRLRSSVYEKFIYSEEYMGYEYLIFELIAEFAKSQSEKGDVKKLFHYTDERLLWLFYDMKSSSPDLSNISKRLLLHDVPKCHGILMSESVPIRSPLRDNKVRSNLVKLIQSDLANIGINVSLSLHMTTDNRKTSRRIDFYFVDGEDQSLASIGEDRQYVLLALISERKLKTKVCNQVVDITIEVLEREGFPDFSVYKPEDSHPIQPSLF